MVIHESAEDYLESILVLQQRRGQVRSIDIVNELGYSKPSVSIAMKKLRENGYISMDADGFITLNESGLEVASRVYGRHKTLSKLFVLLGVTPEVASEDACKVEHDLSEETFRCIQQYLEKMMEEQKECLGFEPGMFVALVDKVIIQSDGDMEFQLKNGMKCEYPQ